MLLIGVDAPLTCMQVHPLGQHRLSLFTGEEPVNFLLFHSPSSGQSESSACYVHKDVRCFCNAPVPPSVTFFLSVGTIPLQPPCLNQLLSPRFSRGPGIWSMLSAKNYGKSG